MKSKRKLNGGQKEQVKLLFYYIAAVYQYHHHNSRRHCHILFTIEFMNEICYMRRKTFTRNGFGILRKQHLIHPVPWHLFCSIAAWVACVPGKNYYCVFDENKRWIFANATTEQNEYIERDREREREKGEHEINCNEFDKQEVQWVR